MTNKELLTTASARLKNAAYSPKKLMLIHAGITALVTFLGSLATHLMTNSMDAAVGLAGLDTRTTLSFVRSLLLFATAIALPFWGLGYSRAAVLYAKDETPTPRDLLQGFRRFFPALRMMLLQTLAIFAVLFLTVQLATALFMFSPFSVSLLGQLENLTAADAVLTEELVLQLLPNLYPVYILWAVLAFIVLILLFYRFRLASFALMNDAAGARAAFMISNTKTRGRRLQLFRLDLHFWWYYGLLLLAQGVGYLDLVLPRLGIAVNTEAAFWVCFLLGQTATIAVHLFFTPKIETTYAQFVIHD